MSDALTFKLVKRLPQLNPRASRRTPADKQENHDFLNLLCTISKLTKHLARIRIMTLCQKMTNVALCNNYFKKSYIICPLDTIDPDSDIQVTNLGIAPSPDRELHCSGQYTAYYHMTQGVTIFCEQL